MNKKAISPLLLLRLSLGLLFTIMGILKLLNPEGIIGMLGTLGFPLTGFLGWIVIFSEVIFGITLLVNYKVKYSTIPLGIILIVALLFAALPNLDTGNPMTILGILWHIVALAGLAALHLDAKE